MRALLTTLWMILLASALTTLPVRAAIVTNFNGGNSTGVVDGYQGMVGDGWLDTWQTNTTRASMASTMVSATSPLSGGGNYLDVSINMDSGVSDSYTGQGCVARTYNDYYGDFSAALSHTIQFQVRIDDTLGSFTTSNDRFYFYDNPTLTSGTSADNTWSIYAFGANYGSALAKKWAFYNGSQDGGAFDQYSLVNTGMTITSGATYTFTISVDPDNKLYNASVTNGTTTSTINGLGFRTDIAQVGRMLHFGGKGNQSAENRDFSLDSILIPDNGATEPPELPTADGFRGIWYSITSLGAPYYYKYSGGFATYPQQINPHSFYSAEANKTFFVYGGTNASNSTIYHMISYYDHATGQVARPRILLDKGTTDAHDNPSLIMDKEGYIYVFSSAHSVNRPSYISRSVQPYEINRFETVATLPAGYDNNFSYAQPFYIPGQGFLLLHTLYVDTPEYSVDERVLCYNTSSDGIHWNYNWETRPRLAQISGGQYQISNAHGQKISTAFNWHENGDGNARTNLYYMQTTNLGATWTTAGGALLSTPVTTAANAALVHDYASENLLVYLKNIEYDAGGNPIIFYLTTDYYLPGPAGDPRMFHTAHWTGSTWAIKDVFTTDHNYDYGPLYVEDDGTWRIIAPTDAGPQPGCTGGEMEMWVSHDEGTSWQKIRELTYDSDYNHTYARQPRNANDDFYSFWADGNAYAESESRLYFTDRLGTGVWKLPEYMEGDFATPELAYSPIGAPGPGDANGDGDVDHEDAAIISAHWMQSDWATWADGDFNRDGEVNALDASILAANWGSHTGAGESLSVPEPSGMMLLLGLVCLPFARRPHAA